MAVTVPAYVQNSNQSSSNVIRGLPEPLNAMLIREALCELDPGQRHFVTKCVESYQVWSILVLKIFVLYFIELV